jgi:hypothetical protein
MTTWDRIEPATRTLDLGESLAGRVADPYWMLARQWQVGELHGEDAASPVRVRMEVSSRRAGSFRCEGLGASAPVEPLREGVPLECRVEAEAVATGPAALRLAAEAGLQLARRLGGQGLGAFVSSLRAAYPLSLASLAPLALPARESRLLSLLAARALDGRRLAADLDAGQPAVPPPSGAARTALARWRAELGDRVWEPGAAGEAWVSERMEHAFSIGSRTQDDEIVLTAREYLGGRLDWYAFDVDAAASHEGPRVRVGSQGLEVLPAPIRFRGMPPSRWWEVEDGRVYYGGIEAGPADLARLVVAEFATVFGGDWFLVPVMVPAGSLSRVQQLVVADNFGGDQVVPATAVRDQARYGLSRPWRMFELAGDGSAAAGKNPWLFVPPVLATSVDGDAVEHVTLVRDEAANLAWAIEAQVEAPTGATVRRRVLGSLPEARAPAAGVWGYQLAPPTPPWFIPFVPERSTDGVSIRLRRARLPAWESQPVELVGPKGRLLAPDAPLRLHEEEVPRGGVVLTRAWQVARGADGRLYAWMGRRKRPGRGDLGAVPGADRIERTR